MAGHRRHPSVLVPWRITSAGELSCAPLVCIRRNTARPLLPLFRGTTYWSPLTDRATLQRRFTAIFAAPTTVILLALYTSLSFADRHSYWLLFGMAPRQSSTPLAAQLAELAETEAAALRDRHKAREAAVRRYETARARLEQAERSMVAGRDEQAAAVVALLETGLDSAAVAQLLGIDARRVREARAAKRAGSPTASSPETN